MNEIEKKTVLDHWLSEKPSSLKSGPLLLNLAMATVCCSALSYGILQVPYARQEGTVEIQALSRSSGVFAEVDGAQKYLRGQRSARFRLQERKNTVFCKAMQGESPSESVITHKLWLHLYLSNLIILNETATSASSFT